MLLNNNSIKASPKISVVVPSFNQGKYIERTLLSILKQEYEGDVEIIVSDGGSTDNTVDILKKYDKQISWWSEKDSGYADAVNKGFRKATGDIFAIQSSDDYYLENAFINITGTFNKYPMASLICGREVLQNPDGFVFGGYILPEIITPRSFLLNHPFPGIFQHTTFFRRKFYEMAGGMRSQFDMCADTDLFYRLLHFSNGYFIDKCTAVYQRHDLQRTQLQISKFENQLLDMVDTMRKDPFYLQRSTLSDEDLFIYKRFINLFYLQYSNIKKASQISRSLINDTGLDSRTRSLINNILETEESGKKQVSDNLFRKSKRIINRVFTKYFLRSDTKTEQKREFLASFNQDWWYPDLQNQKTDIS